jgi:hypothetical protein
MTNLNKAVPGTQTNPSIGPENTTSTGPSNPYNKPANPLGPKSPAKPMKLDLEPSDWHDAGCQCNLCTQ